MTDWRTPGPDRPTDPRDELVQALLGLRWALPRTDADARVALDQLAAVSTQVSQLVADPSGEETPWDGQVQALLAQAGFALDWWRPVLDDVDLDWTLNHQAHLSADLARIASAGARILDQFAPTVPNPAAAPPSAVTEGPPQHTHAHAHERAPRVAAAFGSVPATAIVDPLANSGRHRRPAYEFESFDAPDDGQAAGPQAPAEPEQWQPQPGPAYTAPVPLPDDIEPELEHLFRPQESAPRADSVPSAASAASALTAPIFGPPSVYAPVSAGVGAGPGIPTSAPPREEPLPGNPPPPAFSRPIVWGSGDKNRPEDEDAYTPASRSGDEKRGPHAGMVIQAVGILGAVAALCWWAATSLHLGSSPAGHPAAASSTAAHVTHAPQGAGGAAAGTHTAHPATSAPAAKSSPSGVTPVTTPPGQAPPPNAANVSALQVQLLGGSPAVHQVAMILSVNTSGTGQVTVTVNYYGTKDGAKTDERTASWTLSGKTSYSIANSIPTDSYCGEVFTLKATSGDATSTQSTNPGC